MITTYFQKLAFNSVSLLARSLVSFGAVFFAGHTVAPDQFYLITTGLIVSLLVQTLADWGFNLTIYRERCSSEKLQDQSLIAGKLVWSILIALFSALVLVLADIEEKALFLIFIVVGLLQSHLNLLYMASRAENLFEIEAVSQAIQCTLFVVGIFWIKASPNPIEIALALFIPRVVLVVVTIPYFLKFSLFAFPPQESFLDIIEALKRGFLRVSAIGVFSVLALSNMYIDNFVLGLYVTSTELGLFQAHMRMMLAFITAFEVVGLVIQNDLLRSYDRKEEFKRTGTIYLTILAGLVIVAIWPLSIWYGEITGLLLGNNFEGLNQYFPYLAIVFYLRVLGTIFGLPITFEAGWQRVAILLITVAIAVSLNFALVPEHRIEGALTASVVTHVFMNLSYLFFSYGYLRKVHGVLLIAALPICVIALKLTEL